MKYQQSSLSILEAKITSSCYSGCMFRKRTAILILIGVGLLIYVNSLSNAFLGDDRPQILNNLQIHNLSSVPSFFLGSTYYNGGLTRLTGLYYRPLMLSGYDVLYSLFGPNPFPFHLVQVSIHIINALLVFTIFGLFFPLVAAFLLSLLFLIHPINNEAVVYIANLQDVLFVCFGLGAILFFIRKEKQILKFKTLALSGLFLLLSLFTKETGVAFIAVLLLYIFLYIRGKNPWLYTPLIGSFLFYIFSRYFIAHIGITKSQAVAPIATATLFERLITMPAIIATYLTTFFFPLNLSSSHYWIVTSVTSPDFYLSLLEDVGFASACGIAIMWIRKKHMKKLPQFLFFLGWFAIGLLPHMQFIPLDTTIAERWFYFSGIGLIGMIGTVFLCIQIKKTVLKKTLYLGVAVLFILLSIRTFFRNFDWQDGVTLYTHDIKVTKSSFLLDDALGSELLIAGEYEEAKPYITDSVKLYPFYANLNNAAIIAFHEKNLSQTKYYLQQALMHDGNYAVYENYANFLVAYYSPKEAKIFTKSALEKYPNDPKILFDYGKAEYVLGNKIPALSALKKSETIEPSERTEKFIAQIENDSK
ncbi:MAG: glycosyltransferase family 39 protein [Patescibacteria group bacterium]|nr:glycosyltransferase family 39 protein [Patescibacteria group bacterium]MDE2588940.1 glycosyltransferase family 39 protein [Patescibacteria group bacterium]